jgi:hypothetical protein
MHSSGSGFAAKRIFYQIRWFHSTSLGGYVAPVQQTSSASAYGLSTVHPPNPGHSRLSGEAAPKRNDPNGLCIPCYYTTPRFCTNVCSIV